MPKRGPYLIGGGATKSIPLNDLDRFFPELFGGDDLSAVALYRLVSWTYRCIQLRADAVTDIPWMITRRGDEEAEIKIDTTPYADVNWNWLWWRTEAARLIWGVSYWLKLPNDLQWLNPRTMKVNTSPSHGITSFEQTWPGAQPRIYPPDQIVYLPTWNPLDDLGPGTPAGEVGQPPGALVANANEWTSKFFERGAIPATIFSTDSGGMPDSEVTRVEDIWTRLFGGVKNAFKTAVLRWGLKPTTIGFPLKDLALTELTESAKQQVSVAFGIPITMLDASAANYATAKQDDLHFYSKTVFPMLRLMTAGINRQLWWPLNMEWVWNYKNVEAIQQDEAAKAEGTSMLMEEVDRQKAAGILTRDRSVWIAEQLWDQLGYKFPDDMPDEEPEEKPAEAPGQFPAAMLEQQQRVREIARGVQQAQVGQGKDAFSTLLGYPVKWVDQLPDSPTRIMPDNVAMLDSLRRWRRKAKNRKGVCEFESEAIPDWVNVAIKARMAADLDSAFDPFLKAADMQMTFEKRLLRTIEDIYAEWMPKIQSATISAVTVDLGPMYTQIQSAAERMYTDAISSGSLARAAELGWGVDYEELLTESLDWAGDQGRLLIERIRATDQKYISKLTGQLQRGEITEDAAINMLERSFGSVRAGMIASTETTRALAGASERLQADMAAQGVQTVRRWLTAEDERVCDICGPLDHKTHDVWAGSFPSGPPAHTNCRCVDVVEYVR